MKTKNRKLLNWRKGLEGFWYQDTKYGWRVFWCSLSSLTSALKKRKRKEKKQKKKGKHHL